MYKLIPFLFLAACGIYEAPPAIDATSADADTADAAIVDGLVVDAAPDADLLPSCEALGCPLSMPLFCTSDGRHCACPTDAGASQGCQRP